MTGKTNRYGRSSHRAMTGKVFSQGIGKDHDEEGEQADRQVGDLAVGSVTDIGFAFADEPAGAKEHVADA